MEVIYKRASEIVVGDQVVERDGGILIVGSIVQSPRNMITFFMDSMMHKGIKGRCRRTAMVRVMGVSEVSDT